MNRWVTDTHALIYHLYNAKKLSNKVRDIFSRTDAGEYKIIVPAIVLVEIIFLAEKGRIAQDAADHIIKLLQGADNYRIAPLDLDIAFALKMVDRTIVPDMPDQIITATALHLGLPLLTRDSQIAQFSRVDVVW